MQLQPGAVIADRFRLMRQLGRGGMGEVWAAQHISLDIPCAVKFIHAESASRPETRARFEREAKAAAQLRSPNVVQILDYGVSGDMPYIAMEYLEGEALSARLARHGRLEPAETYRVVAGIAKALQKAHQAGIVHRDLKPENVFLVPDLDGEIAKVLDFGVAKQHDTLNSNTQTGALLGTPYYMSPEQAQGTKSIDHRSDLWSLGVLTFRCLTGELPFKSQALGDLLIKIVTHPIPVPSHVNSQLPPGFDAWFARASQRDPNQRFSNAWELAEQLGVALGMRAGAAPMASPAQPQRLDRTVLTDPAGSAASTPFAQSGASQANVHRPSAPGTWGPGAGSMASPSAGGSPATAGQAPGGAFGATQISTQPYAHQAGGQMPSGSVGGVTAAASPPRGGGLRLAMVVAALAVVGAVGAALFMMRAPASEPTHPAAAADAGPNRDEPEADGENPSRAGASAEVEQPNVDKSADAAKADPAPATSSKADGAGGGKPRPTTASPGPAPTPSPRPKPRPGPSPKAPQPKGYDPGF